MKTPDTRPYESQLRRAQAEATRERILAATAGVLGNAGNDDVMFDKIAKAAGVERRTVFRHFATKADLLQAFWVWIGARVGPQILPGSFDDLVAMPGAIFSGFDAQEKLIRASLHSPSGREMRLQAVPARRAAFTRVVEEGLADLPEADRRSFEALAHLMVSAAAWETLKDYAGLSGADAGRTVSEALTLLLAAMRSRSGSASQTADGADKMAPATTATVTTFADAPKLWIIGDEMRFMGEVAGTHLGMVEVWVPPGSGTPPHRHASPEIFRVVEGEVTFAIFGDGPPTTVTAGEGTVVTIPPWLGHNYTNRSDRPARFTVVLEDSMLRFFRDVGSAEQPPAGPPSEAMIERVMSACQRHGIEMLEFA